MTRYLVATASVHTTAAACDYLQSRVDSDDEVLVLAVREPALDNRDLGDAANVARTRLVAPNVETLTREGNPVEEISAVATERDVDVLVVGPRRGDPETSGDAPGSTTRALLANSTRPVVVLPETALP
ncbi:universal stress protein [Salinibaculum salinum]|uniref:universal stress protein n=1 Tax=Salinibaculum salinum TaxID=3131996 RepID=UPI0030ED7AAE